MANGYAGDAFLDESVPDVELPRKHEKHEKANWFVISCFRG